MSRDVEIGDCGIELCTDPGKVRQILFNLLGNAVKFTVVGGVRLTVRCSDTKYEFAVTDTGPGISESDMPRVFDAFTQLDSPDLAKPEGSGLGLRISREHARLLGGDISVASELGIGSTFTLTIPARPTVQ